MNRRDTHPQAGQTVKLRDDLEDKDLAGQEYRLEDWWINVGGTSWMDAITNPAALNYAVRSAKTKLPIDNEVVYGKVGSFGYLVHVSELANQ